MSLFENINAVVQEELQVTGFDANKESMGGNFERVVFEDGIYPGYLVEYIDLGTQKFNGFQGGADTFDKAVHLGVVVFDFNNKDENDQPRYVILGTGLFPLKVSLNPKAKFRKIFKAFNYNDDPTKKHFAQFLGKTNSYNFKVTKRKSKDGKSEFNVIDFESATPCMVGNLGQSQRAVLPEINERDYALLLWNTPTMEQWNSIRRGAEGVSPLDERNFHQFKVLQATDFDGSPLDLLLRDNSVDITTPPEKDTDDPNLGSQNETKKEVASQQVDDIPWEQVQDKADPVVPNVMPAMPEDL